MMEAKQEAALKLIHAMFGFTSMAGDDGEHFHVVCPYCKYGYVRFGLPKYVQGNDRYEAKHIHNIGVRGDVIVLPFECERGHRWEVVLGEHKGNIFGDVILTHPTFDSPIEQAFWEAWLKRGISFKLIPQHPIGRYRVDFAELETKTVIELDGHATHSSPDAIAYDRKRQREIEAQGWHVVRFGGKEVFKDVEACVEDTFDVLIRRHQDTEHWKQDIDRFNEQRERDLNEFAYDKEASR